MWTHKCSNLSSHFFCRINCVHWHNNILNAWSKLLVLKPVHLTAFNISSDDQAINLMTFKLTTLWVFYVIIIKPSIVSLTFITLNRNLLVLGLNNKFHRFSVLVNAFSANLTWWSSVIMCCVSVLLLLTHVPKFISIHPSHLWHNGHSSTCCLILCFTIKYILWEVEALHGFDAMINSSHPSATYTRQWTGSALV